MTTKLIPIPLVQTFPCLMKCKINDDIVLASKDNNNQIFVTIVSEGGHGHRLGTSYKTDLKEQDYEALPRGTQVVLVNDDK